MKREGVKLVRNVGVAFGTTLGAEITPVLISRVMSRQKRGCGDQDLPLSTIQLEAAQCSPRSWVVSSMPTFRFMERVSCHSDPVK